MIFKDGSLWEALSVPENSREDWMRGFVPAACVRLHWCCWNDIDKMEADVARWSKDERVQAIKRNTKAGEFSVQNPWELQLRPKGKLTLLELFLLSEGDLL